MNPTLDRLLNRIPAVRVAREASASLARAEAEKSASLSRLTEARQDNTAALGRLTAALRPETLTPEQFDAGLELLRVAIADVAEVVRQFREAVDRLAEQSAARRTAPESESS